MSALIKVDARTIRARTTFDDLAKLIRWPINRRSKGWHVCVVQGCKRKTASGKAEREPINRLCSTHRPGGTLDALLVGRQEYVEQFCRMNPRRSNSKPILCTVYNRKKGCIQPIRHDLPCSTLDAQLPRGTRCVDKGDPWKRPRCGAWKKKYPSRTLTQSPLPLSACVSCGDDKPLDHEALCHACS